MDSLESCRLVFVEDGREGADDPFEYLLATSAIRLGIAFLPGRLYRLEEGTGIKSPLDDSDWIVGRLYRLAGASGAETTLALLEDPPPFAFERCAQDAVLLDGTVRQAWVYVYQGSVEELARLFPADDDLPYDASVDD